MFAENNKYICNTKIYKSSVYLLKIVVTNCIRAPLVLIISCYLQQDENAEESNVVH